MPNDPYAVLRALLRAEAARSSTPKPSGTPGPPKPSRTHGPTDPPTVQRPPRTTGNR